MGGCHCSGGGGNSWRSPHEDLIDFSNDFYRSGIRALFKNPYPFYANKGKLTIILAPIFITIKGEMAPENSLTAIRIETEFILPPDLLIRFNINDILSTFRLELKFIPIVIIFSVFLCLCIPCVSAQSDEGLQKNISKVPLQVPPTGTAALGTKESMNQYLIWLDQCGYQLQNYANAILKIFGLNGFNWIQKPPTAETETPTPTVQITATPTRAIPESPGLTTLITVTGQLDQTSDTFSVPSGYWELWYTADPLIVGGQNSVSATGSNSAVFPYLSIQVIAKTNSDKVVETVEPPGGLDKTLWERSGMDPRPWREKFYEGNKEYYFVITAKRLKSYTIEVRIPIQTPRQSGSVVPPETPTVSTTNSNAGQYYNPTQTEYPPRGYVVAITAIHSGHTMTVTYEGGQDTAYLQFITIYINGANVGEMRIPQGSGQTSLPIGTSTMFPVTNLPNNHIVTIGHFTDGSTQVILDTTI